MMPPCCRHPAKWQSNLDGFYRVMLFLAAIAMNTGPSLFSMAVAAAF
jgi:hypothetical protein